MAVNIKFRDDDAMAVCTNILSKPAEERHGITGFWRIDLNRVRKEHIVRLASMNRQRFLLEAEIDPEGTHRMEPKRREEYIDHELVKKRIRLDGKSPDEQRIARERLWKENIQPRIDGKGRLPYVVIAFRNAHAISDKIENLGRSEKWYTKD